MPDANPTLCDRRISRAEGNFSSTRSALPSVDALSTTTFSNPDGTDSRQRPRNSRLFQQTTSVETVEDTDAIVTPPQPLVSHQSQGPTISVQGLHHRDVVAQSTHARVR